VSNRVLVYADNFQLELELVTAAKAMGADDIKCAYIKRNGQPAVSSSLAVDGVSTVYEADLGNSSTDEDSAVEFLEKVAKQDGQLAAILISATKKGKEVAPRLAARIGIGCIPDAMNPKIEGSSVVADRLVWGGNAIATLSCDSPAVLTIPLRTFEPSFEKAQGQAELKKVTLNERGRVKIIGTKKRTEGQANIKDADVVISAGRGFKKKEDLALLDELAKVLGGVIGASRPLTSDLGWMPEDRQVGLSGITIRPKLYIAVGISGQIQHLTGMRDSKTIVAINSDKNAPIFQECDYGVVGDLYSVVPELTRIFKAELHRT
jgi:electron transfer flavoprotein alpha subunit